MTDELSLILADYVSKYSNTNTILNYKRVREAIFNEHLPMHVRRRLVENCIEQFLKNEHLDEALNLSIKFRESVFRDLAAGKSGPEMLIYKHLLLDVGSEEAAGKYLSKTIPKSKMIKLTDHVKALAVLKTALERVDLQCKQYLESQEIKELFLKGKLTLSRIERSKN